MNFTESQPILTSATVVAFVTAILVLLVKFGLPITEDQSAAIVGVVAIAAPFAVIWWAQRKTTPLVDAKDEDGVELTRPDNSPTLAAQREVIGKDNQYGPY